MIDRKFITSKHWPVHPANIVIETKEKKCVFSSKLTVSKLPLSIVSKRVKHFGTSLRNQVTQKFLASKGSSYV